MNIFLVFLLDFNIYSIEFLYRENKCDTEQDLIN